jgi:hypothetical protein
MPVRSLLTFAEELVASQGCDTLRRGGFRVIDLRRGYFYCFRVLAKARRARGACPRHGRGLSPFSIYLCIRRRSFTWIYSTVSMSNKGRSPIFSLPENCIGKTAFTTPRGFAAVE